MPKRIIFEPAPGKLVVQPLNGEQITESGLILPGGERATLGEVIFTYEPFIDPTDNVETTAFYKVGDRVIFGKHGGVEIQYGRKKAIVLKENEILTKVREEEDES